MCSVETCAGISRGWKLHAGLAVQSSVEQVFGGGKLGDFDGGFVREASALEDTGREGKVSSVEHELGVGRGHCLCTALKAVESFRVVVDETL